jgi:hypothetical protein
MRAFIALTDSGCGLPLPETVVGFEMKPIFTSPVYVGDGLDDEVLAAGPADLLPLEQAARTVAAATVVATRAMPYLVGVLITGEYDLDYI